MLDNLIHGYFILGHPERLDYDYEHIYALVTRRVAEAKAKAAGEEKKPAAALRRSSSAAERTRSSVHVQHSYPGIERRRRRDRPGRHPGQLDGDRPAQGHPHQDHLGRRPPVRREAQATSASKYDLIFGDAFNDFSVPWHLTTRRVQREARPDARARRRLHDQHHRRLRVRHHGRGEGPRARSRKRRSPTRPCRTGSNDGIATGRRQYGGFLGAWVKTARQHVSACRDLRHRRQPRVGPPRDVRRGRLEATDRRSTTWAAVTTTPSSSRTTGSSSLVRSAPNDLEAIDLRSRGIILTDDYAPVENLLAPVAATRGEE